MWGLSVHPGALKKKKRKKKKSVLENAREVAKEVKCPAHKLEIFFQV